MNKTYGCQADRIGSYTCQRTMVSINVGGRLKESCWQKARRSPRLVDMVTGWVGVQSAWSL